MQHLPNRHIQPINGIMIEQPMSAPTPERITIPSDHPNTSFISYKVTYITNRGETLAGPESARICLDSAHSVRLRDVPISHNSTVIARAIYRGRANFYYVGRIENNIDTVFIDSFRAGEVGEPLVSTTDTCHVVMGYLRNTTPMLCTDEVRELWASPQITQSGARQLYYGVNQITRAVNNGDSVKLPTAIVRDDGMSVRVINKTPFIISVYPHEGQRIDSDAPNICTQLGAKMSIEFRMQNGRWRRTM